MESYVFFIIIVRESNENQNCGRRQRNRKLQCKPEPQIEELKMEKVRLIPCPLKENRLISCFCTTVCQTWDKRNKLVYAEDDLDVLRNEWAKFIISKYLYGA
ncbi:PREDICTED: uncharacterized protein LOC101305740 [Fragaria vesca subsp. vesca]